MGARGVMTRWPHGGAFETHYAIPSPLIPSLTMLDAAQVEELGSIIDLSPETRLGKGVRFDSNLVGIKRECQHA